MFELAVGVVLGFLASQLSGCLQNKRQARGLLVLLRTDVETCATYFREYRTRTNEQNGVARHWAPAYRLPTGSWTAALPILATTFERDEIGTLSRLFEVARQMNYSLDKQAQTTYMQGSEEHNRTAVKVAHALDPGEITAPLVDRATDAVQAAVERLSATPLRSVIDCALGSALGRKW